MAVTGGWEGSGQRGSIAAPSLPFSEAALSRGGGGTGLRGPYTGRSVLLWRVLRAVPSSRGSARCRLDMATVFLRSITA